MPCSCPPCRAQLIPMPSYFGLPIFPSRRMQGTTSGSSLLVIFWQSGGARRPPGQGATDGFGYSSRNFHMQRTTVSRRHLSIIGSLACACCSRYPLLSSLISDNLREVSPEWVFMQKYIPHTSCAMSCEGGYPFDSCQKILCR